MTVSVRWPAAALSALFLIVGTAVPLCAQSLGDLAKQEEERRRTIKTPSKVYTNKDLSGVPPATAETPKPATTPTAPAAAGAAGAGKTDDKPKDAGPGKDQKYWSGRVKELQAQLDRDQLYAEALQSRINGLTTDFSARDDPAQRAVIGRDRQKALAELDRLKLTIVNDKKAIADLAEEARKAGVPPGWLR